MSTPFQVPKMECYPRSRLALALEDILRTVNGDCTCPSCLQTISLTYHSKDPYAYSICNNGHFLCKQCLFFNNECPLCRVPLRYGGIQHFMVHRAGEKHIYIIRWDSGHVEEFTEKPEDVPQELWSFCLERDQALWNIARENSLLMQEIQRFRRRKISLTETTELSPQQDLLSVAQDLTESFHHFI